MLNITHKIKTNLYNCKYSDMDIDKINHNIFMMNTRRALRLRWLKIYNNVYADTVIDETETVSMALPLGRAAYNLSGVALHGLLGLNETNGTQYFSI